MSENYEGSNALQPTAQSTAASAGRGATSSYFSILALGPLISRDSRPFGVNQGRRMRGLSWFIPSAVAGSFRSMLAMATPEMDFSLPSAKKLQAIEVAGVFPTDGKELYLPAPDDCLLHHDPDEGERIIRLQPQKINPDEGVDFTIGNTTPMLVMLSDKQASKDVKPGSPPAWWPAGRYVEWLTETQDSRPAAWFDANFLGAPLRSTRTHVQIDPRYGTAAEEMIFSTEDLYAHALPRYTGRSEKSDRKELVPVRLLLRARIPADIAADVSALDACQPLGGERRPVHWAMAEPAAAALWRCPDQIAVALRGARRVRMVLVTPAVFDDGWKPGWLDDAGVGSPPGVSVRLRLVGATLKRWIAVSGWSLAPINRNGELDPNGQPGPKPIRRCVPAGATYFFEVVEGFPEELANLWLEPVSDQVRERNDGFGLALWGIWT